MNLSYVETIEDIIKIMISLKHLVLFIFIFIFILNKKIFGNIITPSTKTAIAL